MQHCACYHCFHLHLAAARSAVAVIRPVFLGGVISRLTMRPVSKEWMPACRNCERGQQIAVKGSVSDESARCDVINAVNACSS